MARPGRRRRAAGRDGGRRAPARALHRGRRDDRLPVGRAQRTPTPGSVGTLPRLVITAGREDSGKTHFALALFNMMATAAHTVSPRPANIYRAIEQHGCAFFLDEADDWYPKDLGMREIINSGFNRPAPRSCGARTSGKAGKSKLESRRLQHLRADSDHRASTSPSAGAYGCVARPDHPYAARARRRRGRRPVRQPACSGCAARPGAQAQALDRRQ